MSPPGADAAVGGDHDRGFEVALGDDLEQRGGGFGGEWKVNRYGLPAASFGVREDGVMPKKIDPASWSGPTFLLECVEGSVRFAEQSSGVACRQTPCRLVDR
jgi:hypothetical protein